MENNSQEFSNTPREVDLFTEEAMDEILDTIDSLRAQIEQLQIHCEKLATDKTKVDQALIDKETEHQQMRGSLQEEIAYLRKINLQLVACQKSSPEGALTWSSCGPSSASWITSDAEKTYKEKVEAESKLEVLQLSELEKEKYISSLEWQLVDTEATMTSVQAERDRLALELDCALAREQELDLHALGAVGDMPCGDPLDHLDYGLVESGYVDDMPVRRVRKQPRRHFSDLTKRDNSYVEDFGGLLAGNASLSDYDVPTSTDNESYGLGRLKRATNFSNINDLDECEKFDEQETHAVLHDVETQDWENFDDADEGLLQLTKKRWDKFDDVRDHAADMWSFTPDSIINVSTGEELATLSETIGGTTALEDSSTETLDDEKSKDQQVPNHKQREREGRTVQRSESVHIKHVSSLGERHDEGKHEKAGSEPFTQDFMALQQNCNKVSSDKGMTKKLEEYQRWKGSGCKGDPPAKLKISQC